MRLSVVGDAILRRFAESRDSAEGNAQTSFAPNQTSV
jgi:hypothetical protein